MYLLEPMVREDNNRVERHTTNGKKNKTGGKKLTELRKLTITKHLRKEEDSTDATSVEHERNGITAHTFTR